MPRSRKERGHSGRPYRSLRSTILLEEDYCFLCGDWVDKKLHWTDPGAPQCHMIIPGSRGGDFRNRQNWRLTHRDCNIRQGNRLPGEPGKRHAPPRTAQQWISDELP